MLPRLGTMKARCSENSLIRTCRGFAVTACETARTCLGPDAPSLRGCCARVFSAGSYFSLGSFERDMASSRVRHEIVPWSGGGNFRPFRKLGSAGTALGSKTWLG